MTTRRRDAIIILFTDMAVCLLSSFVVIFIFVCGITGTESVNGDEPACHSRFDYEYKVVQKLGDLERTLDEQKAKLTNLESAVQGVKSSQPKTAFTASLSTDLTKFPSNTVIVFDVIITNIGDSYNPVSGVFACEIPGVYVFYWVTTNKETTFMNTELVLNGVKKGTAMSDSGDIQDYSVASNTIILELKSGDQVWVKSGTWHDGQMAGGWRSTFSGWLLYG